MIKKTIFLIIFFILIISIPVFATHSFDTKAEDAESATNPRTLLYTMGNNATLLVLSIITKTSDRGGGAPTYNGIAFTQAGTRQDSGETVEELWYMVSPKLPPTGTQYTISVPNPNTNEVNIVASSYASGSGYTVLDSTSETMDTTANPSLSITPRNSNGVIVDSMGSGYKSVAGGNNRVLLYKRDTGNEGYGAQYYLNPPTSSSAMSWTQSADDWGIIVASFIEGNDSNTPSFWDLKNNASDPFNGDTINWSVNITNENLNYTRFAHNMSGSWVNQTIHAINGGTQYSYDYQLTLTTSGNICGQFWANDSASNSNTSDVSCVDVNSYGMLQVNITYPFNGSVYNYTDIFNINATIKCVGANANPKCGTIYAHARYNKSSVPDTLINTSEGGEPMFLEGTADDVSKYGNLTQWFRMESINSSDGNKVENWTDSSGNGFIANQSVYGNRPFYTENCYLTNPCLYFVPESPGIADFFELNPQYNLSQPLAIFIVFNASALIMGDKHLLYGDDGVVNLRLMTNYSQNSTSNYFNIEENVEPISVQYDYFKPYLFSAIINGSNSYIKVNRGERHLGSISNVEFRLSNILTPINSGEHYFLYEIITYSGNMTEENITLVENYLYGKYFGSGVVSNPQTSSETLEDGETWNVSWTANISVEGDYLLDVKFNSSYGNALVPDNDTENVYITNLSAPAADVTPPFINLTFPSDLNVTITTRNYSYVNITANEALDNCTLIWNGTNYYMHKQLDTMFYYNASDLKNGNYSYNVTCNDTSNNWGNSSPAYVNISYYPTGVQDISFTISYPNTCTPGDGCWSGGCTACTYCNINFTTPDEIDRNCTGQTAAVPFFVFTNTGDVAIDINWTLNETMDSTVALEYDTDNNPAGSTAIPNAPSVIELVTDLATSGTADRWLWGTVTNGIYGNLSYKLNSTSGVG